MYNASMSDSHPVAITVRFPPRLYERLRADARRLQRSFSAQVVFALLEAEIIKSQDKEPSHANDQPGTA